MIVIPGHQNGPPTSAHGGIAAGRFAEFIDPYRASVRFRRPVPLATPLQADAGVDGASVDVFAGTDHIATVSRLATPPRLDVFKRIPPRDLATARDDWLKEMAANHPFPTCFGCGPQRAVGSGLALRPGKVAGSERFVTPWSPNTDGDVEPWLVWAALDCPSGAPALSAVGPQEQVVTGTISVSIDTPIPGRGDHQIISRLSERNGRKLSTEAALVDPDGRTLATCAAVWIVVPRLTEEQAA